ncbi:large ribosomal subunit protein eL42-like [Littorina saxatilis]|uniref:large ribosomal subunit protein eL42-like n=1 Tax=Littorina saxatilis TaxID=31220 RepID=UPI0038B58A55
MQICIAPGKVIRRQKATVLCGPSLLFLFVKRFSCVRLVQTFRRNREDRWAVGPDGKIVGLLDLTGRIMVNIPKYRRTFCKGKECRKHTIHKVNQYKSGRQSQIKQGRRRYNRKNSGYGGQTKPIQRNKAKTTKKIVLKLECKDCKHIKLLPIKRCKHFELGGDRKRKGDMIQF